MKITKKILLLVTIVSSMFIVLSCDFGSILDDAVEEAIGKATKPDAITTFDSEDITPHSAKITFTLPTPPNLGKKKDGTAVQANEIKVRLKYTTQNIIDPATFVNTNTDTKDGTGVTSIVLTGLQASTKYYYIVVLINPEVDIRLTGTATVKSFATPAAAVFTLSSTAFTDGDEFGNFVPSSAILEYLGLEGTAVNGALLWTRAGSKNTSFPLQISNPPVGTKSYLIVMRDESAGNWIHWLRVEPSSTTNIAERAGTDVNAATQAGTDSSAQAKYAGPQPPLGGGKHTYTIEVFALDTELSATNIDKDTIKTDFYGKSTLPDSFTFKRVEYKILGKVEISFSTVT